MRIVNHSIRNQLWSLNFDLVVISILTVSRWNQRELPYSILAFASTQIELWQSDPQVVIGGIEKTR